MCVWDLLSFVSTVLVVEHFDGEEREQNRGTLQVCQMVGCAIITLGAT
ncbi:MAG: hypothetical protein MI717_15095 [Spirochaetales bacterium]|nr:hypothetical protein [Spirochaetales bacterium]